MSCPCLSAHMPRHSHSMAQVDRGVEVMKVCDQLIPGRVLGIALVALAFSRLASGAFRKQMPSQAGDRATRWPAVPSRSA